MKFFGETQEKQLQELQRAIAQRGSTAIHSDSSDHSCSVNGDGPDNPGCTLRGLWRFPSHTIKYIIQDENMYRLPVSTGDDE